MSNPWAWKKIEVVSAKHKLKLQPSQYFPTDCVDLYGSKINGRDPAQLKQTPRKTRLALTERVRFPRA